jgi:hypothetical protein
VGNQLNYVHKLKEGTGRKRTNAREKNRTREERARQKERKNTEHGRKETVITFHQYISV